MTTEAVHPYIVLIGRIPDRENLISRYYNTTMDAALGQFEEFVAEQENYDILELRANGGLIIEAALVSVSPIESVPT